MKDTGFNVAVKSKVKNGVIQKFLDDRGWTQADLARALNKTQSVVGLWVNMREIPKREDIKKKFESLLNLPFEDIFPDILKNQKFKEFVLRTHTRYHAVTTEMIGFDVTPCVEYHDPETLMALSENQKKLSDALDGLPDREKFILTERYGLETGHSKTLECIGNSLGLSRDRIRQIEAKALRKLRHPKRMVCD